MGQSGGKQKIRAEVVLIFLFWFGGLTAAWLLFGFVMVLSFSGPLELAGQLWWAFPPAIMVAIICLVAAFRTGRSLLFGVAFVLPLVAAVMFILVLYLLPPPS